MEKFKVAAVQMNALKGDLEHNLEVHRRFAHKAAQAGCRLVMFPELSTTAHFGDETATALAQPATGGSIYAAMHDLARELALVISYGFCEKAHGTYYNAQALVGPEGLIGVQRKVHASRDEYFYFRMGRTLEVFDLGFCRVGTLICFDSNFFEVWRVLALQEADVILLPHASRSGWGKAIPPAEQKKSLRKWLGDLPGKYGVYAADNGVIAVFANQANYNGHSTHSGGAFIMGCDGKIVVKSEAKLDDLMIVAELDPAEHEAARKAARGSLLLRRPEIYGELTRMM